MPRPSVAVSSPLRIGIALGGGAARGWAHIGVLRELERHGIVPEVVAGTSIGAIVGACFAAGKLDHLEHFARGLTRTQMLRLMDLSLGGTALLSGSRLKRRLERDLAQIRIEDLAKPFAAVATEYGSGREICLSRGELVEALRASYALPGIFQPVQVNGRWLFDGALSNPIPVSIARALGADLVIAVNLTSTLVGDADLPLDEADRQAERAAADHPARHGSSKQRQRRLAFLRRRIFSQRPSGTPGIASVMVGALSIAQERIARSRLAIDPPDILINARLDQAGLFDFHRAADLIAHGEQAARAALPRLQAKLRPAEAHAILR